MSRCIRSCEVERVLARFNLYRLLCTMNWIIADANERGSIINRRRRELPRIHEQYDLIEGRFLRCVEALQTLAECVKAWMDTPENSLAVHVE